MKLNGFQEAKTYREHFWRKKKLKLIKIKNTLLYTPNEYFMVFVLKYP
jgi:hypothetical protein